MSDYEKSEESPTREHLENGNARGVAQNVSDPSYVDHREFDDRADVAKGRNSDKYEKRYWLSVNYIGTMFAIGMAFMGGIGGTIKYKALAELHVADSRQATVSLHLF
jgi:hypothetical protein